MYRSGRLSPLLRKLLYTARESDLGNVDCPRQMLGKLLVRIECPWQVRGRSIARVQVKAPGGLGDEKTISWNCASTQPRPLLDSAQSRHDHVHSHSQWSQRGDPIARDRIVERHYRHGGRDHAYRHHLLWPPSK